MPEEIVFRPKEMCFYFLRVYVYGCPDWINYAWICFPQKLSIILKGLILHKPCVLPVWHKLS